MFQQLNELCFRFIRNIYPRVEHVTGKIHRIFYLRVGLGISAGVLSIHKHRPGVQPGVRLRCVMYLLVEAPWFAQKALRVHKGTYLGSLNE